jgi:hypothetical protein
MKYRQIYVYYCHNVNASNGTLLLVFGRMLSVDSVVCIYDNYISMYIALYVYMYTYISYIYGTLLLAFV